MKKEITITSPKSAANFSEDFVTRYNNGLKSISVKAFIIEEREKAILLSRFIESKQKEYTCWIPKAGFDFGMSGEKEWDESNIFPKDFIFNDSYKKWFLTAK